ncbi:MAG: ABC transporter ATP-binding protein [Cyclonatronaceae bacterium]
MRELFKLNHYFVRYKWSIILGTLFLTVSNIFLVWIPILIRQSMDAVEELRASGDQSYGSVFDVIFSAEAGILLAEYSAYLIGAVLIYGVLLFLTRQTLIVTSRKIEYDIRNKIFTHLQKLPQSYFSSTNSGDIYVRATEDVMRVREYFGPGFMYTVNTLTRAGIIITIMILVNPELTFWALLPLPFLSVMAYWVSGFIHDRSNDIQEQYARLAGRAQEAFSSIRLIKAYVRETYESKRFRKESEEYRQSKLRLDVIESLFHPLLSLFIGFSIVLVMWQGGVMVIDGQATVGNLAEFIIDVTFLTWPVASLGYTLNLLQRSAASQKRIALLMNEPEQISDSVDSDQAVNHISGDIELKDVSFRYPDTTEFVLYNINMRIPKGKSIGIVGRTGSGKTTLVQLIPRMFDPDKGEVRIDGRNIKTIPLLILRKNIGFVPQETFLFSDTIGENIAFGKEGAGSDEIMVAAEKAQVLDNIMEFDKKFDTVLGERGVTLSGGQKQRTAIARALIRRPAILILDDSLSAVDTKTEDKINDYLREEAKGRTTLLVSHRISSIKNADHIYVLDEGRIIEEGTHQDLLKRGGYYASMYKKQLIEQELAEI